MTDAVIDTEVTSKGNSRVRDASLNSDCATVADVAPPARPTTSAEPGPKRLPETVTAPPAMSVTATSAAELLTLPSHTAPDQVLFATLSTAPLPTKNAETLTAVRPTVAGVASCIVLPVMTTVAPLSAERLAQDPTGPGCMMDTLPLRKMTLSWNAATEPSSTAMPPPSTCRKRCAAPPASDTLKTLLPMSMRPPDGMLRGQLPCVATRSKVPYAEADVTCTALRDTLSSPAGPFSVKPLPMYSSPAVLGPSTVIVLAVTEIIVELRSAGGDPP